MIDPGRDPDLVGNLAGAREGRTLGRSSGPAEPGRLMDADRRTVKVFCSMSSGEGARWTLVPPGSTARHARR